MSSYYFAPRRLEHPLEIISFKPLTLQMRKLGATGLGSLAQDCMAVAAARRERRALPVLVRMFYETPELPSDESAQIWQTQATVIPAPTKTWLMLFKQRCRDEFRTPGKS